MALPLSYSIRNLWRRRLTTILTVAGMALVVFVFAAVLMMAAGLQKTLVETGSPNNVVVVRKGSTSEVMSSIERQAASVVEMLPQVATGVSGQPMMAKEVVVLIALKKQRRRTDLQPFQRRRARHPIRVDSASAAGEACDRSIAAPQFSGSTCRQQHRQTFSGRGIAANFELGNAHLDGGGYLRRGQYGVQLGNLGRCGSGHAGLPASRIFLADF